VKVAGNHHNESILYALVNSLDAIAGILKILIIQQLFRIEIGG